MNHLVRIEAKRIYQKIRRNLATTNAERISDNAVVQPLESHFSEANPIKKYS